MTNDAPFTAEQRARFAMDIGQYLQGGVRYTVTLSGGAIALSTGLRPEEIWGQVLLGSSWLVLLAAILAGLRALFLWTTVAMSVASGDSRKKPKEDATSEPDKSPGDRATWWFRCHLVLVGVGFLVLVAAAIATLISPLLG